MAGAAGFFGEGSAQEGSVANSPFSLFSFTLFFNKLLLLLVTAITGIIVNREIKDNVNSLLFTYPITRFAFLISKMAVSLCLLLLLALVMLLGLMAGTWLAPSGATILPFDFFIYAKLFWVFLVPNIVLASTIVFAIVLHTRNPYNGFLAILVIWILREIILRITTGNDNGALWDPLGENIIQQSIKLLNISQRNQVQLPITGMLMANRFIWIAVSITTFIFAFQKYSFNIHGASGRKIRHPKESKNKTIESIFSYEKKLNKRFDVWSKISNAFSIAKLDFIIIIQNPGFLILAGSGQLLTAVVLLQTNPGIDMKLLPTSPQVLGYPIFFYSFLVQLLTFLYAGVVVNRASQSGMQDLFSVTPIPNWVMLTGKLLAVINMQILLLVVFALSGIILQWYAGYYHIEPLLYLKSLAGIHLPGFIVWAMAAIFVHTWASNTYSGIFILILFSLSIYQLGDIGIQSSLFRFNITPEPDFFLRYSDMNGFGHAIFPFLWYKSYWIIAGIILIIIGTTGWQREKTFTIKERMLLAVKRFRSYPLLIILLPLLTLGGLGAFLFYHEHKAENIIYTSQQEQAFVQSFEHKFKPYFSLPQPVITALDITIDLYPEKQAFHSKGIYTLKNIGTVTIDTLLLKGSFNEITHYRWDKTVTVLAYDTIMQVILVKLGKPLAPQDSMLLHFTVSSKPNTLLTQNSPVLENGTYLKSNFLPRIGWQSSSIDSPEMNATKHHYQGANEHGVQIKTTISTSGDQIALAPGSLTKKWRQENRNYFTYVTESPVKLVFGILSGQYKTYQEKYKGIPIRIYYHPHHSSAITHLMEGVKASYDYNTQWFGPYLHKDINIVAFARSQGTFASLSANCITVSEIRFMQDTTGLQTTGTDLGFYVMAHELTHHWWGNKLLPADAPGANMLTESMAEYITTRIYEKKYGRERAMKFLRIQKNRYLSGIADAVSTENPLVKVAPNEDYIAYGKGSIAFYSLSEKVGEANLNTTLATWMQLRRGLQPPYPLASDLINHLKLSLPPDTKSLLTGLFETTGAENMHNYVDWWNRDR